MAAPTAGTEATVTVERRGSTTIVRLSGAWREGAWLPHAREAVAVIAAEPPGDAVRVDAAGLVGWDTGLLSFLRSLQAGCAGLGVAVSVEGLPSGVLRLLELAAAVPEREGAQREETREPFLAYVGGRVFAFLGSVADMIDFLGGAVLAFGRLLRRKAVFRKVDLGLLMQETGAQALPIVSLISVLIGMILAFVGAYQLSTFGAEVYIAAMVGLATVREMGPMMAGILIAGRTGASFAAQIGTMQVNEEVDALQTMGISPMDFLVLPRMLALGLMMPLLCVYADLLGIAGGAIVGAGVYKIPLSQYLAQTWSAVGVSDFMIGICKSVVFGLVIALAGCMRGIQCGRSASAVGQAATSAVVTGIVAIIVLDSLAAIISTVVGI